MIEHEITIYRKSWANHSLKTLSRDLKKHREGELPAQRVWTSEGNLWEEYYWLHGLRHRENGPAWRDWYVNGNLRQEFYYLNGGLHREDDLPAERRWHENGTLWRECYYLKGVEYDRT